MATVTGAPTNSLSAFNVEIWSDLVIRQLRQVNVASAVLANSDYQGDVNKAGDTVHVRAYGRVTWGDYSKWSAISYQNLSSTSEPLVVDTAKYFAFGLDDIETVTSDQDLEAGYTEEATASLSDLIDTKLFAEYANAHADNKIGTAAAPITLDGTTNTVWAQLVAAEKALNLKNAPQQGRWFILGPDAKAWLSKDSTLLKSAQPIADALLRTGRPGMTATTAPGYLGTLNGFDVYLSNNLPKVGTDSKVTANLFGQGKPVAYASKLTRIETLRLETTFAWAVRGLLLHGSEVFAEHSKRFGVVFTN